MEKIEATLEITGLTEGNVNVTLDNLSLEALGKERVLNVAVANPEMQQENILLAVTSLLVTRQRGGLL